MGATFGFALLDAMFNRTIARCNHKWKTAVLTQDIQHLQELLIHLVLASLRAIKLFYVEILHAVLFRFDINKRKSAPVILFLGSATLAIFICFALYFFLPFGFGISFPHHIFD
jgi:hypothetical protein